MVRQVEITKLDLTTGKTQKIVDNVAEEKPLHLYVNTIYWATILCSPMNLKEMAVGHLLSEGVLKSVSEIEEITLKGEKETCTVRLKSGINVEDRIIPYNAQACVNLINFIGRLI